MAVENRCQLVKVLARAEGRGLARRERLLVGGASFPGEGSPA